MIAESVEGAEVAAHQRDMGLRGRAAFLVKDFVAKLLRLAHILLRRGEPDLEGTEAAEHARQAGKVALRAARRMRARLARKFDDGAEIESGVKRPHGANHQGSDKMIRVSRRSENLMTGESVAIAHCD